MRNPIKVNSKITRFFIKLIVFAIVWQACYTYILKPTRIPDRLITNTVTAGTAFLINNLISASHTVTWHSVPGQPSAIVQENGKALIAIFDICNGLDLLVIYLAFIILLPYGLRRKIFFGAGGIIVILLANMIRCASLYWIYVHYHDLFDINHHYVFTLAMYLIIFSGWLLFINKQKAHEAN